MATSQLKLARGVQTKKTAAVQLKGAVQMARWTWANNSIAHSSIWEVAIWQHGHKMTKVPPIMGEQGLMHNHTEMTTIFSSCFFVTVPSDIPLCLSDDPP